jgi:hypothetical protein
MVGFSPDVSDLADSVCTVTVSVGLRQDVPGSHCRHVKDAGEETLQIRGPYGTNPRNNAAVHCSTIPPAISCEPCRRVFCAFVNDNRLFARKKHRIQNFKSRQRQRQRNSSATASLIYRACIRPPTRCIYPPALSLLAQRRRQRQYPT